MANENVPNEVWEQKDIRMCRMNALNRATDIACAMIGKIEEKIGRVIVKDEEILERAEKYFAYIYGKSIAPRPQSSIDLPQPTQEQQGILETIAKQVGIELDIVKGAIYKHYKKYPTNKESIEKIIKKIFKEQ